MFRSVLTRFHFYFLWTQHPVQFEFPRPWLRVGKSGRAQKRGAEEAVAEGDRPLLEAQGVKTPQTGFADGLAAGERGVKGNSKVSG